MAATDNLKHRCMLQLLYAGGLRIGEVINLKVTDVRSDRNMLFIRGGKGKKDRTTVLSQRLLENLREYYKVYKPKVWLFEGQFGGQYTVDSIRNVFKAYMGKLVLKPKLPLIRCATRLPRICWSKAPTYGIYKRCWGTAPARQLKYMPT